jgi:hypothetical protein
MAEVALPLVVALAKALKPQAAEGRPTEMAAQGYLNERGGRSTTRVLRPCL